ncbi:MAG: dehydrogenase [SAR86 cluster bacterium]|uniref:Dehydrogenase n=1 Tax=SAR86 cluster bacterium TaxID=2030880 RepID=A0A2A5C7L1_9GAMM|nr:SDR family oxidoreductase [Gammaproteobacteria bacterium AH-315-E17]PCJ39797.1 MAG: dehydrogenase [SAR86 cluster bacterium]
MTGIHAGKVAVVTGGSSGIGQAIVTRLVSDGAKVAIADISESEETLEEVANMGGEAFSVKCDISDATEVASFFTEVEQRYGEASILVHCAAHQFVKSFEDITLAEWEKTQAVNQGSMFHLLKGVLPGMKRSNWGRVIVIASSTFFMGGHQMSHYVTSKGALIGLVRGLSGELGDSGITINAVAPGLTKTKKAMADLPEELFQEMAQQQSIKRSGTPEDQSGVVSFMASEDAAFITGQTILVDGGQGYN